MCFIFTGCHIIYRVLGRIIFTGYLCIIFTWCMRVSYLQGIRVGHIIYSFSVLHIYRVLSCVILFTEYRCGLYLQGICACVPYLQGMNVFDIYRVYGKCFSLFAEFQCVSCLQGIRSAHFMYRVPVFHIIYRVCVCHIYRL